MDKIFYAAKYIRSSSSIDEELQYNTITSQNRIIDAFLSEQPDIVVDSEWIDENYSGVTFERPAFKEMLAVVFSGRVNCIICKDLTRLGRNFIEVGRYLRDLFPSYGVRFIAINDDIDTFHQDIQGDTLISLKSILNEQYSRDISQKTRSALFTMRKEGNHVGASAIYGYKKDSENKHRLVQDDYAADIVNLIFSMKLMGMSAIKISVTLNEKDIPSPQLYKYKNKYISAKVKPQWHPSTISRILKDENYTGTLVQGRQTILNFKTRKLINKPECEWIKVPVAHEPIVSQNVFEQVQRLLRMDIRAAPGKNSVYPFSGLIVCRCCENNMIRKATKSKGKAYIYYNCPTGRKGGCSSGGFIREDALSSAVMGLIKMYLSDIRSICPEKHREQIVQLKHNQLNYQVKKLEEDLARNKFLRAGLSISLSNEIVGPEEHMQFKRLYDKTIARLNRDIESSYSGTKLFSQQADTFFQWLSMAQTHQEATEIDRAMAFHMIQEIVVSKDGSFQIQFNYQDECQAIANMEMEVL